MALSTIEDLKRDGWSFEYDSDTRFITGSHPKGGKFSVCEIASCAYVNMDDLGDLIAHMLNNWGAAKEGP